MDGHGHRHGDGQEHKCTPLTCAHAYLIPHYPKNSDNVELTPSTNTQEIPALKSWKL